MAFGNHFFEKWMRSISVIIEGLLEVEEDVSSNIQSNEIGQS
jgi:hypothetical protein